MDKNTFFYLILSLLCVFFQGFFSMFEMAAISFNKVRLQYLVSKKKKRAIWLYYLLKKPGRLFATSLIAVNIFLLVGAEASRRFYQSIGLSSNLAPITQIIIVIIFAELAPLFAARGHSESISMFNIPILYFLSKLFLPFTYFINLVISFINFLFRKKEKSQIFLTREEIQKVFEEEKSFLDLGNVASNIFSLKKTQAKQIMVPITYSNMISSTSTLLDIKKALFQKKSYFLLYYKNFLNIVGVVYLKDLLNLNPLDKISAVAESIWFVVEDISILDLLKQFKQNKQKLAIILNRYGKVQGIVTLDLIIDRIFKSKESFLYRKKSSQVFVEKNLYGSVTIEKFNQKFKADLPFPADKTLSDLIKQELGHIPYVGESIHIDNFEFIVKKTTLFGIKKVLVKNIF